MDPYITIGLPQRVLMALRCAAPRRPTPTASPAAPTKSASRRTTPCRGFVWRHPSRVPMRSAPSADRYRVGAVEHSRGPMRSGRGHPSHSAASEQRSAASRWRAMGVVDRWMESGAAVLLRQCTLDAGRTCWLSGLVTQVRCTRREIDRHGYVYLSI